MDDETEVVPQSELHPAEQSAEQHANDESEAKEDWTPSATTPVNPDPDGAYGEHPPRPGVDSSDTNPPANPTLPQPSGTVADRLGAPVAQPKAEAGVIQEQLAAGTQASQGWVGPGGLPGMEATTDGPNSRAGGPRERPFAVGSSPTPGSGPEPGDRQRAAEAPVVHEESAEVAHDPAVPEVVLEPEA